MRSRQQGVATNAMVFMASSSDHVTGVAGATLTITASKDGAAFASITPTVTDRGSGWYNLALTTAHTDTLGDLALHATAAGCDPSDLLLDIVAYNPEDAAGLGLSRLDATVGSRSTLTQAQIVSDATPFLGASIATIKGKTDNLPSDPASTGDVTGAQSAIQGDIAALNDVSTADLLAQAGAALTTYAPATPADVTAALATLNDISVGDILAAVVEGTVTLEELLRIMLAALAGKASGGGTTTIRFRDRADAKNRIVATVDANGNRTAVTVDGA
jgi:hypothetical protein